MRNKGLIILCAVLLLNMLCFAGVYAYSVSRDAAANEFTVGDNEIEIHEVFEQPYWVQEGDRIQKEVTVTNSGRTPCSVRLFVKPDDMEIMNNIRIDFNTESWYDGGDGYYYYKGILPPGETTEELFSTVEITGMTGMLFHLYVVGESRTAEGNQTWNQVWADKVNGR